MGGRVQQPPVGYSQLRGTSQIEKWPKWVVSNSQKAIYDTQFYSLRLKNGKASRQQIMKFMLQSQLSNGVLQKVWDLANFGQDGQMDDEDFALCLHLIDSIVIDSDEIRYLDSYLADLPLAFIPPGKRHLVELNYVY